VRAYEALGITLPGKVGVKVHSGEVGNQNFTRPAFVKPMVDRVHGTIIEANTAYNGKRGTTAEHWETMRLHGWTDIAEVDILDETDEIELPVPAGHQIQRDYVGAHLANYDSVLILSHFKGHPMGGFGGALKNTSIGIASAHGKAYIHAGGVDGRLFDTPQDEFLDAMADAAKAVFDFFGPGKMAFVSIMKAMSVDCDCCAVAEDPALGDIGVLASLDPVALDQACVDLVYASDDPGKSHLIERIESRHGLRTIEQSAALGSGTREYELVSLN
jgi:uncharacterized Fe-S center protein